MIGMGKEEVEYGHVNGVQVAHRSIMSRLNAVKAGSIKTDSMLLLYDIKDIPGGCRSIVLRTIIFSGMEIRVMEIDAVKSLVQNIAERYDFAVLESSDFFPSFGYNRLEHRPLVNEIKAGRK